MDLEILPKLTKEYILSQITQEEIFQRFLGIPVVYDDHVNVPSFLRDGRADNNPSGSFKWSGFKLRFKDWSGNFWGDCFDVVGVYIGVNPNSKTGFYNILEAVAREFGLHKYKGEGKIVDLTNRSIPTGVVKGEKAFKEIKAKFRLWSTLDADYWNQFCIHKGALKYFDVYPAQIIWCNGELVYTYRPSDPAYIYYQGKDEKGRDLVQVYYPFRASGKRFLMNHAPIFGLNKIQGAEIGVITKSCKDVMCIKCITHGRFSVESIAPSSESHVIPKDIILDIWTKYDYIVTLMDFDYQGRNMAWKLKTLYGLPPLFFTNGKRGTRTNYGSKDFSDYVKSNGKDKTLTLVNDACNYIKNKFKKTREYGGS